MFSKLDFCEVCNLSKKKCICNKVKCECCQKSFSNKSNLKAHLRNKDVCDKCGITKGKCKCNKVQCTCCDKTFANKNTLKIHQKNKIENLDIAGDKEVHKCHKCHNTFDSKHSLGVHISNEGEIPVILLLKPDPLHINILGPPNDVLELLEELYPVEMKDEFYVRHNLRKSGEGPGGKFNGPSIKYILREEVLKDLESTLPTFSITEQFSNYLRSIRDLHRVCTAKKLNLKEAKKVINNFSDQFYNLYMEFDLSMTLKTHIIIHHYMYFFQKTKKTMRLTNGEFHESCHSTLRQSEERSNFKVKRKIGTPMHQYKSW